MVEKPQVKFTFTGRNHIVHLERNYAMSTFLKIHFFAIFELLDIEL